MVSEEKIWQLLQAVSDPEVPVLSVLDLGIVRAVRVEKNLATIVITPTYSGCPAMSTIEDEIRRELAGIGELSIETQLSPAWTTDWMSEEGKRKLKEYGIAPPVEGGQGRFVAPIVPCPRCESHHTKLISHFGSTACKAMYQCQDCFEPFDYFKCHR